MGIRKRTNNVPLNQRGKQVCMYVTLVDTYALTDNENTEENDKFFDKLHSLMDEINTDVI